MSKDDNFWLNVCYLAFALVVAFIGYNAISTAGIQFGWSERYDTWFPMVNNISAIAVGAGSAFWLLSGRDSAQETPQRRLRPDVRRRLRQQRQAATQDKASTPTTPAK